MKDSVQLIYANVDGCQIKEWLLFNEAGNQANIRFMEFCMNYIKSTYIQSRKQQFVL